MEMKVAVYDTYVPRKSGEMMHFDIIVSEGLPYEKVLEFEKRISKVRSRRTTVKREGM